MRQRFLSSGMLLTSAFISANAWLPSVAAQVIPNPCAYKGIDPVKYGNQPFKNPTEIKSQNGVLRTTLRTGYTDPAKVKLAGCGLTLRTYNGDITGPTLRIRAGDTLHPLLSNRLPKESAAEVEAQFQQESGNAVLQTRPHSFNTTNLHTHGLHVSPKGNGDNVLLAIAPGTDFQYNIPVPANHPPGTYWYHAHTHGSTAIQVGSGMAGALIIDDDPAKIPPALRAANDHERVLVIQTILYNESGKLDQITALFPAPSNPNRKTCETAPGTWQCSKRRMTVNGQITPIITMRPGEVQRWRVIDTSFRESVQFQLQGHDLNEIALDGIYLGRVDTWKAGLPIDLEPGYRSDVLVKASMTPGTYNLIDAPSQPSVSLLAVAEAENIIAKVVIAGEPMNMQLPTSAEMASLAPFPGVDLSKTAVGVQQVTFKLGEELSPNPKVTAKNYFQVNYGAFNPNNTRRLQLGATDQWNITTVGDPASVPGGIPPLPHVFHIHVNPFQWIRPGPGGAPEMVWKDTLLIPAGANVTLYTRYLDYTGKFVLHCHILDHEDLGMMEVEEVVDKVTGTITMDHDPGGQPAHSH